MNYAAFNFDIQEILEQINAAQDLDLELDPSWTYPIFNSGGPSLGYMIQRSSGELRILSVAVDVSGLDDIRAGPKTRLSDNAREKIINAVEVFWSKGNTTTHTFIDIANQGRDRVPPPTSEILPDLK